MALDEILFRQMEEGYGGPPVLRFYMAAEPWITVGYSHRNGTVQGIPVCRRMTGGGIVQHGKDVIFSIVARKADDESFASVRMSYLKIHEAVKSAVENLGKSPRFYRCDENLAKGSDCFLYPIATDLALAGRKIAGGAQKRSRGALLHQESLQLRSVEREDLIAAVKTGFQSRFAVELKKWDLDPVTFHAAQRLAEEKYGPDKNAK